jgi:hypothetical protein
MAFTDYGGGASNGQSPAGSQSADFNGGASAGIVEQRKKSQPSATQQNPATAAPPSQTFAQMQALGQARPTPDLVAKTTSALGNEGFHPAGAIPQANAQTPAIVTQTNQASPTPDLAAKTTSALSSQGFQQSNAQGATAPTGATWKDENGTTHNSGTPPIGTPYYVSSVLNKDGTATDTATATNAFAGYKSADGGSFGGFDKATHPGNLAKATYDKLGGATGIDWSKVSEAGLNALNGDPESYNKIVAKLAAGQTPSPVELAYYESTRGGGQQTPYRDMGDRGFRFNQGYADSMNQAYGNGKSPYVAASDWKDPDAARNTRGAAYALGYAVSSNGDVTGSDGHGTSLGVMGNLNDPEFQKKIQQMLKDRVSSGGQLNNGASGGTGGRSNPEFNTGDFGLPASVVQTGPTGKTDVTGTGTTRGKFDTAEMSSPTDRVSMALGPNSRSNMVVEGETDTGVNDPNKPFNGGNKNGNTTTTTDTTTGTGNDWTWKAPNHPAYNPPKIDPVTGIMLDSYSSSDPSGMYSGAGNYTNAPSAVNDALQQFTLSNMQNPSRYSTDAFNSSLQSGLASLGRQFGAQNKQLDENMARRGISSSSFAGGYYGDLAGQQADSTNSMLSGLLTNQANNWAADQSAAASSAQNLMNSQNQNNQFMNNLAQQLGIAQMGNATANRGITSQEGIANANAKNAAAMQMQSLMQQLGIAKMGDYTANRGIDTNANAQQNEWLMKVLAYLQQYLPKAP